ncbi:MAG TPA: ChbG/HpnK family deacetylase [Actinomycetota bacterium]
MDRRLLIVNGDDFGQGHGVNRGVFRAFEDGILTSASAMVRWTAVWEAAAYARDHPSLGVGLHVDLGEWAIRGGEWVPLYEVVPMEHDAVLDEVLRQVSAFRGLFGRDPTHLDSHQHRSREEPVLSAVRAVADNLGVPLRDHSTVRHCGSFYGQTGEGESRPDWITVDALLALIRACGPGVTELACHPGDGSDPDIPTMYKKERALEAAALCHPRARGAIEEAGITLVSYLDLEGVASGHVAPGSDTASS